MISFYEELLQSTSELNKIKKLLEYHDIIDTLISKKLVSENEYNKIFKSEHSKIDALFDIIKTKSTRAIKDAFEIFKSISGFKRIVEDYRETIIFRVHQNGGFPKLNKYVKRTDEERKLKECLPKIKMDRSLVVHGRIGEGKSYLVCQCLRDEKLTRQYFDNKLYWINVGECKNGESENEGNCLQPLTRLLRMMTRKKSKEIYQYDEDDIIDELKYLFTTENYQRSLVILDNARSLTVIKKFQEIFCNLLIISHLKNVNNSEFIEVGYTGFSLPETVNLFAQYLDCYENELDRYLDHIKEINDLCKGHPSTLALLGAFLNDRKKQALNDHKPWNYIKDKISKGEMEEFDAVDEHLERNFNNALKMCIDSIKKEEYKTLYYQFAIFPKDANISSEVLEVFWQKSSEEVRTIMSTFENRSLINSFYNLKKQSYIYVIHDLFLIYLRKKLSKDELKQLHCKLIHMYEKRYKFSNLPDDNYILPFLGYHLKQAEMNEKFESFLDLRFIGHKIKLVGANNMEQDLITYEKEIINGKQDLRAKWELCLNLVKNNREEFKSPKTDILQLALPTLNKDVQQIMKNNEAMDINKLYFNMKLSVGRVKDLQEFNIGEEITSMCYCYHYNVPKVLLGLNNGNILLYCLQTSKQIDQYEGNKGSVIDIKVSSDESTFLSVSSDSSVKIWQFISPRFSFDETENVATSPKILQQDHYSAYNSRKHPYKELPFKYDGDYIISANFSSDYDKKKLVVAGTHQGRVVIWDVITLKQFSLLPESGLAVENVFFNEDNSRIFFSKLDKVCIYKYEEDIGKYIRSVDTNINIVKFFVTGDESILTVNDDSVNLYRYPYNEDAEIVYENKGKKITVAMAKKSYFVIGCEDEIFIHDVQSGKLVEKLELGKISTSLAIYVSRQGSVPMSKILINLNDGFIQQYNIFMKIEDKPKEKPNLVTSFWRNNTPVLALTNNQEKDNSLTIQSEFSIISQHKEVDKVLCFTFSLCGNKVIFALANGLVKEYIFKKKQTKTILQAGDKVKSIQCFDLEKCFTKRATDFPTNIRNLEENNWIVIVTNNQIIVYHDRIQPNEQRISWEFPIFQAYPLSPYNMVCIDERGGIFTVKLDADDKTQTDCTAYVIKRYVIQWGQSNCTITAANVCPVNNLLASCVNYTEHANYVNIYDLCNGIKHEDRIVKSLEMNSFSATCCAFSENGSLLAVGRNDGKILVFNLLNNYTSTHLCNGPSSVNFLQFSPSTPPILVAVGKEISWWNLSKFEEEGIREDGTQNVVPRNMLPKNSNFDKDFWIKKTSHDKYPYLLQLINLYSSPIYFSVSTSFETFLIVDNESRIYILNCLKSTVK